MNATAVPAVSPGFEHIRSRRIETLDMTVHEFAHIKTGARHYHLEAAHRENVFMVAFRTVPMDSTGVAHMLEHTALCGSKRYPVRDPFFWMIRRSLNTFMNAFTTSDYTAYPFASQNRKDFSNLLDVYLDAVFFSRLDPLDFAQEGHRVEFESPHDPTSPLVFRGVVYNEMKGDSSSPISILYETLKKHLYPTTTYHFNSGGDPAHIPELTYDDLVAFYRSHYHPGNAIFMTFGDLPVAWLQQAFQDKALGHFDSPGEEIAVGPEVRYTRPLRVEEPYGVDKESDTSGQTHIVLGWLLGKNTDLEMLLKCNLLSDALLDTSASPLRLALESSELAGGVSPLCGLEETSHEMSFVCGVEGSERIHADAVEALIMKTLERVAEEGIATDKLEACLHQLELNQREIGGDGTPFGLQLMFSCISAAIHRGDPIDLLDLEPVLLKLRQEIRNPDFIKSLVRELLLDNTHRVRLTLYPDQALNQQLRLEEATRLEALKAGLGPEQVQRIIAQTDALARRQDAEEDISILPKVSIEDVSPDLDIPIGNASRVGNGPTLTSFEAGTNGLVYHQIITRIPALAPDSLVMLPYLTNLIGEIGSGGLGYLATQHLQHSKTGGISAFSSLRGDVDDPDRLTAYMVLSSRTLTPKAPDLLAILKQTLETPDFNESSRLRDLVKQSRLRRQGNVTGNAHGLAMSAAASYFRPVSLLNHQLSGLASIVQLKKLDDALSSDEVLKGFVQQLSGLHQQLVESEKQLLLVSEPGVLGHVMTEVNALWSKDNHAETGAGLVANLPASIREQAWVTNTQVNFCASAFKTVAESHPDSAALSVLGGVLRNSFLHKVLREQGGAYGGGASHDSSNGVFRFYSYRDPHLMRTFDAFEQAVDWVINSPIDFDLVEEAILGIVSSIDAPGSPAGQARQAFHQTLFGRNAAHRRAVKQNILNVTVDDIKRVAVKYLQDCSAKAVVTNEEGARLLPDAFDITLL